MIKISDYIQAYSKQTNKGECKACGKAVQWSRQRLASHKRGNCYQSSPEEKRFFHQVSAESNPNKSDMSVDSILQSHNLTKVRNIPFNNKFLISDYLENYDKVKQRGKCKSCSLSVQWTQQRLASHKRATCTDFVGRSTFKAMKSNPHSNLSKLNTSKNKSTYTSIVLYLN